MAQFYFCTPGPQGGVGVADGRPSGGSLLEALDKLPARAGLECLCAIAAVLSVARDDRLAHGALSGESVWLDGDGAVSVTGLATSARTKVRRADDRALGSLGRQFLSRGLKSAPSQVVSELKWLCDALRAGEPGMDVTEAWRTMSGLLGVVEGKSLQHFAASWERAPAVKDRNVTAFHPIPVQQPPVEPAVAATPKRSVVLLVAVSVASWLIGSVMGAASIGAVWWAQPPPEPIVVEVPAVVPALVPEPVVAPPPPVPPPKPRPPPARRVRAPAPATPPPEAPTVEPEPVVPPPPPPVALEVLVPTGGEYALACGAARAAGKRSLGVRVAPDSFPRRCTVKGRWSGSFTASGPGRITCTKNGRVLRCVPTGG